MSVLLLGAVLVSCERRMAPQPLLPGRHRCARCGMMISEIADAAEYVSVKEETRFYDDLGCAAEDAGRVPIRGKFFVRADGGAKWIAAEDAFFAKTGERTPMGHGFFAFSTAVRAMARDSDGRALRWPDVGGGR